MSLAVRTSPLDVIGVDGFAHLDYAATAPCVRAAADAVTGLLPYYGSVHRGTGLRSQTSTWEYERASAAVGAGEVRWATGPARHEGGTPNLLGAVALAAVCAALLDADRAALYAHEQELLAHLRAGLGGLEVSLFGPHSPRVGIVSLAIPEPSRVAERLAAEHGVGVRAGQFCAHPLVRHLTGRSGAAPCGETPGLLRVSFGLGTTTGHLDRLLSGLRS